MDMSSSPDFNSAVNNLLQIKSTTSLVKTTAQEMIKDAQKNGTITKNSPDYNEEMDYNSDGEITISEKLRYYTEQTAQQITEKLQTPNNDLSNDLGIVILNVTLLMLVSHSSPIKLKYNSSVSFRGSFPIL